MPPETPEQQVWHAKQMKWKGWGWEFGPKDFKRIKQTEKAEDARKKNTPIQATGISRKKDERGWSQRQKIKGWER